MSAVQVLMRTPPAVRLQIAGRPDMHGSVVLIGAGKHYGGPVPVFPKSNNQDRLLDVIIFRALGGWEFAQMVRAILERGYDSALDIDYLQVRDFTVIAAPDAPFEVDGELATGVTPVHFRAADFKIQIAV
jgi:diacylglycerol kinase family enzyme